MDPANQHIPVAGDKPLFDAVIRPHRSLSRKGFVIVMAIVALISFGSGLVFFVAGAWPVIGFCGLDVLLIWLAFRANFRAANAYERVRVTAEEIEVSRMDHRGRARAWRFNPAWVRLERREDEEFGLLSLSLAIRDRQFEIARDLSPGERQSFAANFAAALSEAKRGPTRTAFP